MRNRYPQVKGPAAEEALKLVRFETEQVCLWAGICPPLVHIVANLRSIKDDVTADVRALRHRRGYEMNMPLRVVESCTPDALRWLVAHEVGHAAAGNPGRERLRVTVLSVALISALFCLGTTVSGAVADLSGGTDPWGFLGLMTMGVFVLALVGISALRRADERRADVFATAYLGEVRGAEQYFAFTSNARRGSSADRFFRAVLWPLRTHPSHRERLRLMREQLSSGGEPGIG